MQGSGPVVSEVRRAQLSPRRELTRCCVTKWPVVNQAAGTMTPIDHASCRDDRTIHAPLDDRDVSSKRCIHGRVHLDADLSDGSF
jgi:hypothetical protein